MYDPNNNNEMNHNHKEEQKHEYPTYWENPALAKKETDYTPEDVPMEGTYSSEVHDSEQERVMGEAANPEEMRREEPTAEEKRGESMGNGHHGEGVREEHRKPCYEERIKRNKPRSKGWAKLIAGCLIVGLAGGTSIGAGYGLVEQHYGTDSTEISNGITQVSTVSSNSGLSAVDIVKNVKPSVVSISTVIEGTTEYMRGIYIPYEGEGAGSGVIFYQDDEKVAIVTNNHVIEDATEVYVTFDGDVSVKAKVVGTKADSDLAVLTVSRSDLKEAGIDSVTVATFGDSDQLEVGAGVIAIGNAMGLGLSATDGIVSVTEQTISVDGNTLNVIQTSAAINSGNSGGALVNSAGEVIGINTAKYNSTMTEGMGYAIPSNEVIPVMESLLTDGTAPSPYIGVMGTDITEDKASLYKLPVGALIMEVTEGGPADQAGIEAGDIITEFNGKTVMDMESLSDIINSMEVGQTASVHIIRNGETGMDLTVTIADKNA
ncbi:trypsin-like peptidase domain-containing protein [Anaerotignum lactatifermentans]|uniref:Trypsin-like peptidase domain-containing protein n=1 Tax=Anaerotignum lactatifermentans TaxID=160404 RepID=A0ABS2G720_9FIRM|nr:trypsin-like peptidase domain-containing protein [Anaerotignum lactatifermentans]MBM6828890.1 trypsin-like peptidase domain-containing protein [Anaerotignum lactatifermentans]MBM6876937.1 trypsin-like peptidase domain-containing protein [Anaerotignum lactatifermentans]MBM6950495.1 trypsin-like peptidase domain-containing protein [Anaerotignum lactatifermentans]